jgi:hypothetical protein
MIFFFEMNFGYVKEKRNSYEVTFYNVDNFK